MKKRVSRFVVKGGKPLKGTIRLSGAKNCSSKLFIASLLTNKPVEITNCPCQTIEMQLTKQLCESLGTKFEKFSDGGVVLQTSKLKQSSFSAELGLMNRIGILTVGPLLYRTGKAKIAKPGGDRIGKRPIDFHLDSLRKLGAEIKEYSSHYELTSKKLIGANITLPFPSVGATENIIISACLAEGTTFIHNAAVEPEIIDLILFLQKMGAVIDILIDRRIVIRGVGELGAASHSVIPDRLEAASLASAAIASKGSVTIEDARQSDMISFLNSVRLIGAGYEILPEGIKFYYKDNLKPIAVETNVHPGFMTDWQAPFVILLTQANGVSIIHETVYENRLGYVSELKKMGADIELYNDCLGSSACRFKNTNYYHSAVVKGPSKLRPANINVPDIRAGFSYLVAAILAKGESVIDGAYHIDRGYEKIDEKLRKLGVNIKRVE